MPAASFSADMLLEPTGQALFTELSDSMIMMDVKTGDYLELNLVCTRIWQLLADGKPLGEIYGILQTQFVVDAGRCKSDVDEFVADLLDRNLVRPVS